MSYRDLYVVFNIIAIFHNINCEISLKKNEKHIVTGNNDDTCFKNFDVTTNRIIKTEDSLELGAKYLNVMDVESREDCSKFCCNTDKCDVFIFEEKKPGSCYLFECGLFQDSKCKFTPHVNYTSAVRSNINIHSRTQSEEEIQISEHEHELKSLRKLADIPVVEYPVTERPVKSSITIASRLILTTPPPKRGCSRNQYECRLTGDCIAIYNVCDGIPQCADGSDEAAADLVCPTEKPTALPSVVIQGPSPQLASNVMNYQHMIDQHKAFVPIYPHGPENNLKQWELPNIANQVLSQSPNLLYPQMEIPHMPPYQWGDYQPLYEQNKDSYIPGNSYREQSNFNPYDQNQPRIFSHKGSGIMREPDVDGNVYADSKNPSHYSSPNKVIWQETQVQLAPSIIPNLPQKLDNRLNEDIKNTVSPPCETSVQHTDTLVKEREDGKIDKKKQEEVSHIKIDKHNVKKLNISKIEVSKQNHGHKNELTDHKSIIIVENHAKEREKNIVIAEHLQQINDNDNLRPKGAVISLTLGLITTAITAALIACRLRIVKRRGHRGHGPYAHDADYLVNGMYL